MYVIQNIDFLRSVVSPRDLPDDGVPEICISGRSNVGKSSLINRLTNRRNIARVSRQPGKTRALNYFFVDSSYYLVDLPGYGYAKVSKAERSFFANLVQPYLSERKTLAGIIQLIDSRHGPVTGDLPMIEWLRQNDRQVLYVLTKADKLSGNERAKVRAAFVRQYETENCILFSSHTGLGVDCIGSWIADVLAVHQNKVER